MFRPKGMSEMRDAGDRWEACDNAVAACGLKIVAPNLENVLAGTTLRQTNSDEAKASHRKRPSRRRKYLLTSLKKVLSSKQILWVA